MPTEVTVPDGFKKRLNHLARRFPSVLDEVESLIDILESDERPGDKIPNIGYDVYKVRLKNRSAKKGKRGGFRVIYYIRVAENVIMVTLYSKTDQDRISSEALRKIIEEEISSLNEGKNEE